jgi:hypothetical protein
MQRDRQESKREQKPLTVNSDEAREQQELDRQVLIGRAAIACGQALEVCEAAEVTRFFSQREREYSRWLIAERTLQNQDMDNKAVPPQSGPATKRSR